MQTVEHKSINTYTYACMQNGSMTEDNFFVGFTIQCSLGDFKYETSSFMKLCIVSYQKL